MLEGYRRFTAVAVAFAHGRARSVYALNRIFGGMILAMRRVPLWVMFSIPILVLIGLGIAMSMIPTNYVAIEPHRPTNLDGLVRIDNRPAEPLHGRLFFVGVEENRVSMLQKWILSLDDKVSIEYMPPQSAAEQNAADRQAIESSKDLAGVAAFELLGRPARIDGDGARVIGVLKGGPADGVLRAGDRIVRINGAAVRTSLDINAAVGSAAPGTRFRFGVRRNGLPAVATLTTGKPDPQDTLHRSRIGVYVSTIAMKVTLPRKVRIRTSHVGGPSAGLPFALAIFDALSPVDLIRGRYVVATGQLTLEGQVLPIGGIRQKVISSQQSGAELMLVPKGNADDAARAAQRECGKRTRCISILPVASVADAVRLLRLPRSQLETHLAKTTN